MKDLPAFFKRQDKVESLAAFRIVASHEGVNEGKRYCMSGLFSLAGFAFRALTNQPWCVSLQNLCELMLFNFPHRIKTDSHVKDRFMSHDCTLSGLWTSFSFQGLLIKILHFLQSKVGVPCLVLVIHFCVAPWAAFGNNLKLMLNVTEQRPSKWSYLSVSAVLWVWNSGINHFSWECLF